MFLSFSSLEIILNTYNLKMKLNVLQAIIIVYRIFSEGQILSVYKRANI